MHRYHDILFASDETTNVWPGLLTTALSVPRALPAFYAPWAPGLDGQFPTVLPATPGQIQR